MKKITIFSVIVAVLMVSVSFALAKEMITGYDVNNNFAPVKVEKGVYTPGISLYPYETKPAVIKTECPACDVVGGTTNNKTWAYGDITNRWDNGTAWDATTTLFTFKNPWGATAYIDRFIFNITVGATSSAYITCGTTTSRTGLAADPSDLLIDDFLLATSTAGTATTTGILMNGLAGGSRTVSSGFQAPGTNSEDIIVWKSAEYIACYADYTGAAGSTDGAKGFTDPTNQFTAKWYIHSFK
jgi:hypothetical protein